MTEFSRRAVLALGAAGAAGILVEGCDTAPAVGQSLEAKWIYKSINGIKAKLRSYNGQVPGPLLTTKPGETLRVRLKNSLTPYDSSAWDGNHNIPHHLDATNLHVHGLDVAPHLFAPLGTSDPKAPMIHAMPGQSLDYAFELPKDHPSGLYWYHPHSHGSTAVQAVSGMAGAIIVKGDIDEVPEIRAAKDYLLAIQDIGLFPSDTEAGVWTYEPKQNAIWQTFGSNVTTYDPVTKQKVVQPNLKGGFTTGDYLKRFYLLNGAAYFQEDHNPKAPLAPTPTQLALAQYVMAPGEVARFRILNGCSDNLMPIVVDGHEVHLLALDGVNFPAPRTIPVYQGTTGDGQILMAPANRAEFLIKAGKPGRYAIRELGQDQQFLSGSAKVIAEIVVTGAPKPMALPKKLPLPARYYPLISSVKRQRRIVFGGNFPAVQNPVVGIDFLINGTQYDETTIQQNLTLGDSEEWVLSVDHVHGAGGSTEGHPFHIHVNHFEVISIGGVLQPPGTIQDTIWVPNMQEVVIRTHYKDFRGKAVYHCHILPHEDTGMMQNIMIS